MVPWDNNAIANNICYLQSSTHMKNQTSITLSIKQPCHESWENMTAAEKGKFCQSCQTIVTDFTRMSDEEIVRFVNKTTGGFCGRFDSRQLNRELEVHKQRWYRPASSIAAMISALYLFIPGAKAQTAVKVEQIVQDKKDIDTTVTKPTNVITGVIKDESGTPLPGVVIRIDKALIGATTNSNGLFLLKVPDTWEKNNVNLKISYIGYIRQELSLSLLQENTLNISLAPDPAVLDETVVIAGYTSCPPKKPNLWRRLFKRFRH